MRHVSIQKILTISALVALPTVAHGRLEVHEWGVWKVRAGQVAHLAELAAECPPFVFRAPGVPQYQVRPPTPAPLPPPLPIIPGWHQPPARKPVVFFHADVPTRVSATVTFAGGQPWLYYPSATVTGEAPLHSKSLTWTGQVIPSAVAHLAAPPAGSFWNELRAVGASLFLSDSGQAERFVFYDGPVRFQPSFRVQRGPGGALVAPLTAHERTLWLAGAGQFVEHRVAADRTVTSVAAGDMALLRARLDNALQGRGLSPAESRSLLESWRDDLFSTTSARAISFLPRQSYDAMLPMAISPVPDQMVRVGMVIDVL